MRRPAATRKEREGVPQKTGISLSHQKPIPGIAEWHFGRETQNKMADLSFPSATVTERDGGGDEQI